MLVPVNAIQHFWDTGSSEMGCDASILKVEVKYEGNRRWSVRNIEWNLIIYGRFSQIFAKKQLTTNILNRLNRLTDINWNTWTHTVGNDCNLWIVLFICLKHSSMTLPLFVLPTLSVTSEENGRRVSVVDWLRCMLSSMHASQVRIRQTLMHDQGLTQAVPSWRRNIYVH